MAGTIFSLIYGLTFIFGFFIKNVSELRINVFIKEENKPIEATNLISESDDFYYFEKKGGLWEAVRKEDIKRIEEFRKKVNYKDVINRIINKKR